MWRSAAAAPASSRASPRSTSAARGGPAPPEPPRASGLRRALRARRGMGGAASGLASVDGPPDEDAGALRAERPSRGDRHRRVERHVDIDVELEGLTELQSGSYCVMDLDYRRIGGRNGPAYDQFEMALTVLTTVVSRPSAELAIVDAGFKSFSTDRPFVPEAVEAPGPRVLVGRRRAWTADHQGPRPGAAARRPHRVLPSALRSHDQPLRPHLRDARDTVEAVWEVAGRGRSQ